MWDIAAGILGFAETLAVCTGYRLALASLGRKS